LHDAPAGFAITWKRRRPFAPGHCGKWYFSRLWLAIVHFPRFMTGEA
jgi:hypothetical protein